MAYVDLRPYKPRTKKRSAEVSASATATESSSPQSADATTGTGDFFSHFSDVGKQSDVTQKSDVIDILNLLNEKLSAVEERLFRIERKIESKQEDD